MISSVLDTSDSYRMTTLMTDMTSPKPQFLRAVRGATTVSSDSPAEIQTAVKAMMAELLEVNDIIEKQVVTVFFSLTPDITSASPAKIARESLEWTNSAFMSSVEPDIKGFPALCIRVLIQFYTHKSQDALTFVYHNDAKALRDDLS